MTAIIGFTKRSKTNSVGILYTDDLVDNRKAKVDKITKVSDRFALSIAGREIASTLLYWILCYFDQFSPSKNSLASVDDLIKEINNFSLLQ